MRRATSPQTAAQVRPLRSKHMSKATTITLPRLEGESSRAYAARVEYVTMGAGRSLEKVADQRRIKGGSKAITPLREWSIRFGWVESAKQYDEQMVYVTIQEAQEAYRADLADYRKRYGEMGKALYQAAGLLLRRVVAQANVIDVGAGSLTLITNAAKTAADLEALSLRVEALLQEETQ
jgi:hypothetical protein